MSALWWEWYRYGVCSSTAELTECDWKILWTCIYLGMIFYHTVLLLMIHYHHHHFLRIILWFWEWKNSGYTLIYYYYYYYNMFLDHVFMSLWAFSSHGVFIFVPIFNRIVNNVRYLGHHIFKALFLINCQLLLLLKSCGTLVDPLYTRGFHVFESFDICYWIKFIGESRAIN